MSRILFMGAPYEVSSHRTRSLEDSFAATGHNTGNLLIGYGLRQHLRAEVTSYSHNLTADILEEQFDRVVIAAANFLYPGFDFTPWSSLLDKISLPVTMVGLGAQVPNAGTKLEGVPDGTWRLVEIAAERSHSIGVRGEFTAELLRRRGLRNVEVTGCPSLYTHGGSQVRLQLGALDRGIVLNGSRNVTSHAADPESSTRVEKQLFDLALRRSLPFVLQNEQPEMQLAHGRPLDDHAEAVRSLAAWYAFTEEAFVGYWRDHGKAFFDVPEWFSWIERFGFSVGTRFHGNVAALLNGVPAVVLTHDSRTQELCDFASIPHRTVSSIQGLDMEELYAQADFGKYEAQYPDRLSAYIRFLEDNDVPHDLSEVGVDGPAEEDAKQAIRATTEEAQSPVQDSPLKVRSRCSICRRSLEFEASNDYYACRAGLRADECPMGGCVTRERALAKVILTQFRYRELKTVAIHEAAPSSRGLTLWLRKNAQNYVASGYFPAEPWGRQIRGLQNENLEAQTFDDGVFDLVLHLDVMEHLFDPFQALRECWRTLKPGGICVFTAPTYPERLRSEQVAFVEADGSVRVVGDPEYHGNPQDAGGGSLVTWRYGYDLPLRISRETQFDVEVRRFQSRGDAIMGPMTEVYLLSKID